MGIYFLFILSCTTLDHYLSKKFILASNLLLESLLKKNLLMIFNLDVFLDWRKGRWRFRNGKPRVTAGHKAAGPSLRDSRAAEETSLPPLWWLGF